MTYSFDEATQTLTVYSAKGVQDYCKDIGMDRKDFNYPTVIDESVIDCMLMFCDCKSFNQPVIIPESVTDCTEMFYGCSSFNQPITIPALVHKCKRMFEGCTSFSQTVSVPSVFTECEDMFLHCPLMTKSGIPRSKTYSFDESSQTVTIFTKEGVKEFCKQKGIELADYNYKTIIDSTARDYSGLFEGCASFNQPVVLTCALSSTAHMFKGCTSFNQPIDIPNGVHDCVGMFKGCTSFNQPVTIPDFVYDCCNMFDGCTSFNQPVTIPFSVTKCIEMFRGCSSFNQPVDIPMSTEWVTRMFMGCSKLHQRIRLPDNMMSEWELTHDTFRPYDYDDDAFRDCPLMSRSGKPRVLDKDGVPVKKSSAPEPPKATYALEHDVPTLMKVLEKHPVDCLEWFFTNFPNGASSAEEVLSKLKEE